MYNNKMRRFIITLICLFLIKPVFAEDFNNVKFLKNHDGDTFTFDLGNNLPELFRTMPLRLYGIDTPEVGTKNLCEKQKGVIVRDFAHNELINAKQINLVDCSKDKYFRILCRVSYDGKDLTNELLQRGYGYEYYGKKKKSVDYSK